MQKNPIRSKRVFNFFSDAKDAVLDMDRCVSIRPKDGKSRDFRTYNSKRKTIRTHRDGKRK